MGPGTGRGDVEPAGLLSTRPTLRVSRVTPSRRQLPARLAGVQPEPSGDPGAPSGSVKPVAATAQSLMEAVDQAARDLGPQEIDAGRSARDILADDSSLASAAKWRSGSLQRRFTAALAKLTASLKQWTSSPAVPAAGPPPLAPVRPRPLREAGEREQPRQESQGLLTGLRVRLSTWKWGAVAILVIILLFPRVMALLLALLVRLVVRACFAVATHFFRELWWQASLVTSELEEALVQWLSFQLGLQTGPIVNVQVAAPTAALPVQHAGPGDNVAGAPVAALPARPFDFVTRVLLALNLYQNRHRVGVGGLGQA